MFKISVLRNKNSININESFKKDIGKEPNIFLIIDNTVQHVTSGPVISGSSHIRTYLQTNFSILVSEMVRDGKVKVAAGMLFAHLVYSCLLYTSETCSK